MVFRAEQLRRDAETPTGGPTVPTVNLGPHSHDAPPESHAHEVVENVPGGLMDGDNVQAAVKAKDDQRSAAEKTEAGLHPNAAVDSDDEAQAALETSAADVTDEAKKAAAAAQRNAATRRSGDTDTVEQATAAPGEKRDSRRTTTGT